MMGNKQETSKVARGQNREQSGKTRLDKSETTRRQSRTAATREIADDEQFMLVNDKF